MVKFYFIIEKMLTANLTSIIITTNHSHLNLKWNISSTTARFGGFCKLFCNENYGANMAKYCAFYLFDFFGDFIWILFRIELINLYLKQRAESFI